ncbi:MAG: ABC transporter ATP-binding protein [Deltaproteobacteria bacterium]|nr:ABC transporter ATP-binding protein [Deltaproteobacteria bacterium]
MSGPLVEVTELRKTFRPAGLWARGRVPTVALDAVSFALAPGEFAALVGESGSGKTTLGRCLLGLVPFDRGTVRVAGFDVANLGRRDQPAFRRAAQMVFQNPYASLNPALRVRSILAEALGIHRRVPRAAVPQELEHLAHLVHLPVERLRAFPPSLSGGERRRVAFARALATSPSFVVTDEPVSGLDLPIQVQLLDLLRRVYARRTITFLFISHDLKVVRYLATRVLVLYRGRLVEDAPAGRFFGGGALHPYCHELLRSAFEPERDLAPVGEGVHSPLGPGGCPYRHRCPRADVDPKGSCATMPPTLAQIGPDHRVACHRWDTALDAR